MPVPVPVPVPGRSSGYFESLVTIDTPRSRSPRGRVVWGIRPTKGHPGAGLRPEQDRLGISCGLRASAPLRELPPLPDPTRGHGQHLPRIDVLSRPSIGTQIWALVHDDFYDPWYGDWWTAYDYVDLWRTHAGDAVRVHLRDLDGRGPRDHRDLDRVRPEVSGRFHRLGHTIPNPRASCTTPRTQIARPTGMRLTLPLPRPRAAATRPAISAMEPPGTATKSKWDAETT